MCAVYIYVVCKYECITMVLYADIEFIGTCVYAGVSRSFIVISHRLIIEYTN